MNVKINPKPTHLDILLAYTSLNNVLLLEDTSDDGLPTAFF